MAKATEFGVRLPVAGPLANTEDIRRSAVRSEELGFDAVWVHDFLAWTTFQDRHHVSCGSREAVEAADSPPVFFESLTNMAFLAGITNRIRIGVAVLCLPYRNPLVAAKQVANIDVLSNGRVIFGIGTGAPKSTHNVDFEVLGIPRKTKYHVTRDYLRAMKTIWTEDFPSYEGEYFSFPETEIWPKPVQKPYPPIWTGGHGPTAMDITAEFSTGWIPPDEYPGRISNLDRLAAEKGRGGTEFDIATEVYVSLAETREEAISSAQKTLGVLTEGFDHTATQDAIAAAGLIGDADDVGEKIGRYVEAGVNHYEMKFIYHTVDHLLEQLEHFASAVAPAFNGQEA
ncbi:MAG: LLM class flavin-dependent oxidoreductase [Acidimicrobiia bacterium]|nr:LLM class flavin-dependent oxidoreductase [Acidimicrobiia bacterium]